MTMLQELVRFRDAVGAPAVLGGVVDASGKVDLEITGVRRRGSATEASIDDRVHIGSCLKMVTAALYGTFVEEGRTDWQNPITELFPDLEDSIAAGWRKRTVAELFHCLAGMAANPPRRYLNTGYADERPLPEQRTELASLALSKPPRKPGRFVYSNLSYIVMGAAIDRLAGSSFEDVMTNRILRPLGIDSAGYGPPPEIWGHAPKLVIGGIGLFQGKAADPSDRKSDNPPAMSAAGTLHLNAGDWARLLRLFLNHADRGVLKSETVERILQMPDSKPARMAMGWAPSVLDGVSYGAQGSNMRWAATALMDDAREKTVFVVCNDGRSRVLGQSAMLAHRLLTP